MSNLLKILGVGIPLAFLQPQATSNFELQSLIGQNAQQRVNLSGLEKDIQKLEEKVIEEYFDPSEFYAMFRTLRWDNNKMYNLRVYIELSWDMSSNQYKLWTKFYAPEGSQLVNPPFSEAEFKTIGGRPVSGHIVISGQKIPLDVNSPYILSKYKQALNAIYDSRKYLSKDVMMGVAGTPFVRPEEVDNYIYSWKERKPLSMLPKNIRNQ